MTLICPEVKLLWVHAIENPSSENRFSFITVRSARGNSFENAIFSLRGAAVLAA
jgi:hypothetical protein